MNHTDWTVVIIGTIIQWVFFSMVLYWIYEIQECKCAEKWNKYFISIYILLNIFLQLFVVIYYIVYHSMFSFSRLHLVLITITNIVFAISAIDYYIAIKNCKCSQIIGREILLLCPVLYLVIYFSIVSYAIMK
jgi:hypothetical protein